MTLDSIGNRSAARPSSTRRISTPARVEAIAHTGLLHRPRHARKHHRGSSRWVALAVLGGALVAAAFVNFLAH